MQADDHEPHPRLLPCPQFAGNAQFEKVNTSNSVDLPDPLAPTTTVIGGRSLTAVWRKSR